MAGQTIAELLVTIGVEVEHAKKAEKDINDARIAAQKLGTEGQKSTGQFGDAFRKLAGDTKHSVDDLKVSIGGFSASIGAMPAVIAAAGAAFVAAGVGIFKFVESNAEAIGSLKDLSATVGVGVEELQRLQFAASQSGVEGGALNLALKTLNNNLLDMKSGGGAAATEALASIGLRLEDLEGLSRTQQFGTIADALQTVGDAGERSARAAQIFGSRAGPQLASLLSEGSVGLERLAQSAQGVFTAEQVNAAEEFGDQVAAVENEVTAFARTMAIELLPLVREAVDAVREWVAENREWLRDDMAGAVAVFSDAVRGAAETMGNAREEVGLLIDALGSLSGLSAIELPDALDGLGTAILKQLTPVLQLVEGINALHDALVQLDLVANKAGTGLAAAGAQATAQVAAGAAERRRESRQAQAGARALEGIIGGVVGGAGRSVGEARGAFARGGRAGRGGGGGGAAARPVRAEPEGVTVEQFAEAFLGGRFDVLQEKLKGFAASAPSTRDVKPTVAIDITINNIGPVTQNIATSDPVAAGAEAANKLRALANRGVALAAQALAGNVVR